MGRGEGWVEVPCFPRVGSVDGYVVSYNTGVYTNTYLAHIVQD